MSMAPRMTVAAVSAPTAASTGDDMSMGASQVAENVSPQVVMVTGKPVCAQASAQASAYDPGGLCRVVLATLNAHMHLVKMSFARGMHGMRWHGRVPFASCASLP